MKKFEIKITIEEGNDEFWEGIGEKPGIDEVYGALEESVTAIFPDAKVKLTKFTDE